MAISSLAEMPADASVDLKNMRLAGMKSFMGVPVRIEGDFRFVFTLSCLKKQLQLNPDLINRIQLVAQLMGNALHRKETETKTSELAAEIRQYRKELSHLDRTGTIGALTATIAHEIKQPLAAILSNAQAAERLISRNPPDLEEIKNILADIIADDKRASSIINNVRSLLKKEERHHERVDLNALIAGVIHLAAGEASLRRTIITADLAPHLPTVLCDPILIQQVILNLLINAMDASDGLPQDLARITILSRSETDWIDVEVRDMGPGLPEPIPNALENPFFTSKPDGLGIGLILCHSIIESHGGRMSAENHPEGGARFSFRLPVQTSARIRTLVH